MKAVVIGDTELWIIQVGDMDVPVFAVPVEIEQAANAYDVKSALMLPIPLHRRLTAMVGPCCLFESDVGWVVAKETFEAMARRARGITASYYFRKTGSSIEHEAVDIQEKAPCFDPQQPLQEQIDSSFPQHVWERTGIAELATVRMFWNAFSAEIAYWLIVEEKEIDFGWIKLRALPYRDNWKQLMMAKFPALPHVANMSPEEREGWMAGSGFNEAVYITDLIKLNGRATKKTVGWTVEVEHSEQWDDYVLEAETQRLSLGVGLPYVTWWGNTVRKLRPYVISILLRFASQTRLPAGTTTSNNKAGRSCFVEYYDSRRMGPVRVDDVDCAITNGAGVVAVRNPNGRAAVPLSDANLSALPSIRLKVPYLRPQRRNVDGQRRKDAP